MWVGWVDFGEPSEPQDWRWPLLVVDDDVDQLNALAKTAVQTAGQSHGPQQVIGDKSIQAGDVIRTR